MTQKNMTQHDIATAMGLTWDSHMMLANRSVEEAFRQIDLIHRMSAVEKGEVLSHWQEKLVY